MARVAQLRLYPRRAVVERRRPGRDRRTAEDPGQASRERRLLVLHVVLVVLGVLVVWVSGAFWAGRWVERAKSYALVLRLEAAEQRAQVLDRLADSVEAELERRGVILPATVLPGSR